MPLSSLEEIININMPFVANGIVQYTVILQRTFSI